MAAMRYAARRLIDGQPPQLIYRAAVAEEQRRLLPTVIHGGSSAVSRRFISMQRSEAEGPSFEGRWRIYRRGAHLMFRTAKAVSTIVASGIILKLSVNELLAPGYSVRGAVSLIENAKDKVLRGSTLEAEMKSLLKDGSVVHIKQLAEHEKDGTTLEAKMDELKSLLAVYESHVKHAEQMEVKEAQ